MSNIADLPRAIILARLEGRSPEEISQQLRITPERAARGGYAIGRQIESTMKDRGIDPVAAREAMTPRSSRKSSSPEEPHSDRSVLTLRQRDAMAESHKTAAPHVFADAHAQVSRWVGRYRKLFTGFNVSHKSDNTGGLSYDRANNRMKISWNEVANSAGTTYQEALRSGASEAEARETAGGKVRSILDEELRHVADVRANGDAATKDLWYSLPPEIQDATKRIYSHNNPESDLALKSATRLGYEFKRILSQHDQTGEVSELAEITKAAAEKAANGGSADRGGWIRAVMDSLKRMADWLRGNAGTETARQLDALHDALEKITSGKAVAPGNPSESKDQNIDRLGSKNDPTEYLASSRAGPRLNDSAKVATKRTNGSKKSSNNFQSDALAHLDPADQYQWQHDIPQSQRNALNRLAHQAKFPVHRTDNGTYMRRSGHIIRGCY